MSHESDMARARKAIAAEQVAKERLQAAREARDAAINAALSSAPDGVSDNEIARQLGLQPATLRSITAELRRRRRNA